MPKIIETRVICKQKNKYIGWPTVAAAPDGTIHAVFSGDRQGHICPFGKTFIMSTSDGGGTWTEPRVVNDTPLDDRGAGICACPDGTLVLTWYTSHYYQAYEVMRAGFDESGKFKNQMLPWSEWEKIIKRITPDDLDKWAPFIRGPSSEDAKKWANAFHEYNCETSIKYDERFAPYTRRQANFCRRSSDGGQTWDEPTIIPTGTPHGATSTPDGALVHIGYDIAWSWDFGFSVSNDKGLTWQRRALLKCKTKEMEGTDAWFNEPHVVAAPSGKLVGMTRYQAKVKGEDRYLWQFDSEDGGHTWSEPRPTPINGYPPHLLRVSDGRLLTSCSTRHEPQGNRFCFSEDEGKTWNIDDHLFVEAAVRDTDQGYPSTAEVAPGEFLSVYYQKDQPDEKPCLMMTRWEG